MNRRPSQLHYSNMALFRRNLMLVGAFERTILLLCVLASLIAPFRASAVTDNDGVLQKKVISAIKDKRGYPNSVAVSISSMIPSIVRGFLNVEVAIQDGQESSKDSVSLTSDGRFYTEAPLIPLHSAAQLDILTEVKEALGSSYSDIAITEATPWIHEGFRHGYVYSTRKRRPMRQDYYLADDGSALVLGDLYYLFQQQEIAKIDVNNSHIVLGSRNNKPVLVIFSDFQCPSCAELEKKVSLAAILKADPGITIVLRDYPLPYHTWAREAALANACAYTTSPGKYLSYREELFKRQDQLTIENAKVQFIDLATKLGFDGKLFEKCIASEAASKAVDDDIQAGDMIQLAGTPTAFLNGESLPATWTIEDLHLQSKQSSNSMGSGCRVTSQTDVGADCRAEPKLPH